MTIRIELPSDVAGRAIPALRQQLLGGLQPHTHLIVDCSHVQHLSRPGQALLVALQRTARSRGVALSFTNPSDAMTRTLRTTGLRHLLAKPTNPTGNLPRRDA